MKEIRVPLVEDEPILAMIIRDTPGGSEFGVTLAVNGEEGFSRYVEINLDIIVTNVMMPGMDGFTMAKLICKTDTYIPVLFLSARSAANDVVEGFETGGNDYLKKPFDMAELIMRIKALLYKVSVQRSEATSFRIGSYTSNSVTQTSAYRGEKQPLSDRESEILKRFCDSEDQVLPMREILVDL